MCVRHPPNDSFPPALSRNNHSGFGLRRNLFTSPFHSPEYLLRSFLIEREEPPDAHRPIKLIPNKPRTCSGKFSKHSILWPFHITLAGAEKMSRRITRQKWCCLKVLKQPTRARLQTQPLRYQLRIFFGENNTIFCALARLSRPRALCFFVKSSCIELPRFSSCDLERCKAISMIFVSCDKFGSSIGAKYRKIVAKRRGEVQGFVEKTYQKISIRKRQSMRS